MSDKRKNGPETAPDFQTAALCGLFCPSCRLYLATHEEPEWLEEIASRYGVTADEIKCDGCRSGRCSPYCRTCKLKECAAEKGVEFCGDCPEFPCEKLKTFQAERAHRIDLFPSLERIRAAGWERWLAEMREDYSCPDCGALNSAYEPACRKCGREPSCAYVGRNREKIAEIQRAQSGGKLSR